MKNSLGSCIAGKGSQDGGESQSVAVCFELCSALGEVENGCGGHFELFDSLASANRGSLVGSRDLNGQPNPRMEIVVFARLATIASNRFLSAFPSLQGLIAILCTSTLIWIAGCGESANSTKPSSRPGAATASPSTETKSDVLAEILQLAKSGDTDTAIQRFVSGVPDNWIESTSLADLRMSEAAFAKLDRFEKTRLQKQFIDRAVEIKGFTREVIDRAKAAKKQGDNATADRYLEAVNRFGRQLRDYDTVLIFQQAGKALAELKLSE